MRGMRSMFKGAKAGVDVSGELLRLALRLGIYGLRLVIRRLREYAQKSKPEKTGKRQEEKSTDDS